MLFLCRCHDVANASQLCGATTASRCTPQRNEFVADVLAISVVGQFVRSFVLDGGIASGVSRIKPGDLFAFTVLGLGLRHGSGCLTWATDLCPVIHPILLQRTVCRKIPASTFILVLFWLSPCIVVLRLVQAVITSVYAATAVLNRLLKGASCVQNVLLA